MTRPTPFFIVNVEGVVRRGERYLLTVRSEHETNAPGTLSLPGGKVKFSDAVHDTLEHTLKREILEETGVEVSSPVYLESKWFRADDSDPVVDTVFLCDYRGGEAGIGEVLWLTAAEVAARPKSPPWTRASVEKVKRLQRDTA